MTMLTQATADKIIGEIAKPVLFRTAAAHFAFTLREIEVLQEHPGALQILMDHHEARQTEAAAIFEPDECPQGNAIRKQALYERGRSIMGEDLDIWPDDLRKNFGFPRAA